VAAQELPIKNIGIATALESLPEVSDDSKTLLVTKRNVASVRQLVAPELLSFIESGRLVMPSARKLPYLWRYHDRWERRSGKPWGVLKKDGSIDRPDKLDAGFPFGRHLLKDESITAPSAGKLLWNMYSTFWSQGDFEADFDLITVRDDDRATDEISSSFAGRLTRSFPSIFSGNKGNGILFREKIRFVDPPAANWFSWLTFRFSGVREDMVWVYSPAIEKVREITDSNRSDSFFQSVFAPDDFFSWSAKPENVSMTSSLPKTYLMPFPSLRLGVLDKWTEPCQTLNLVGENEFNENALRWNIESRRFFEGDAWVPSNTVWVPRKVVVLELIPKDPYSEYGRQKLYIDLESYLPLLKVVYDKAGEFSKLVISTYGSKISKSRKNRMIYPYYTVAVGDAAVSMMRFHSVKYCRKEGAEIDYSGFDPSHLGPGQAPEEVSPEGANEPEGRDAQRLDQRKPAARTPVEKVPAPVAPAMEDPEEPVAESSPPSVPAPGGLMIE
jgi:hypothetical protein